MILGKHCRDSEERWWCPRNDAKEVQPNYISYGPQNSCPPGCGCWMIRYTMIMITSTPFPFSSIIYALKTVWLFVMQVINFHLKLVLENSEGKGAYAFDSFFYPKVNRAMSELWNMWRWAENVFHCCDRTISFRECLTFWF